MSKMIKCKICGGEIESNAKSCLNCGEINHNSIQIKYIFGAMGIFFLLIFFVVTMGFYGGKDKKINTNVASASTENNIEVSSATSEGESKSQDTTITYKNFLDIKMEESYDDVVNLLGNGKESASNEIDGIQTNIYEWKKSGSGYMTVTVQNNVVVEKSQLGLESIDSQITMDKYNQVENGISYEELTKILGEGVMLSQAKLNNIESSIYEYINKNESNASFTFSGGKLIGKSQYNLD
ncbi:hypothetical protein CLPUN_40600 [Clostridium puniceum]|uniref:DUF3862 domain-containing protein n=1 Tax=Clostridium puniceum TaxID=29367 RepID=A0A1S8T906_9CLOT|nr:DUF3862 domain-containing protein [Clostridium puniceum]OOM74178.1 hypothetical protein CLPUN_40600 [Clostridium puniceum]